MCVCMCVCMCMCIYVYTLIFHIHRPHRCACDKPAAKETEEVGFQTLTELSRQRDPGRQDIFGCGHGIIGMEIKHGSDSNHPCAVMFLKCGLDVTRLAGRCGDRTCMYVYTCLNIP